MAAGKVHTVTLGVAGTFTAGVLGAETAFGTAGAFTTGTFGVTGILGCTGVFTTGMITFGATTGLDTTGALTATGQFLRCGNVAAGRVLAG